MKPFAAKARDLDWAEITDTERRANMRRVLRHVQPKPTLWQQLRYWLNQEAF